MIYALLVSHTDDIRMSYKSSVWGCNSTYGISHECEWYIVTYRTTHAWKIYSDPSGFEVGRSVIDFICNAAALQWRHNECDGVSNHRRLDFNLIVCSGSDQRKHQSSASNTWKIFPFDGVIMPDLLICDDAGVCITTVLCLTFKANRLQRRYNDSVTEYRGC